ncbi:LOW QUALITY PROTEIN: sodium/hydrogen exchanger 11, partial [Carlito syrichta]|uniref:LOW QUALITY PROTEIN: sodium/hydrogen exchanger 11 n=1 Tax=Carlito syrichta TaxID=1868482 RepID=A0A1U7T8J4_CARSF
MNSSFWIQRDSNRPDLFCGRPADYLIQADRFPILVCFIVALGGFLRICLNNSEGIALTILSLSGFVIGQLAYNFVGVHQIVSPLLRTPSFSLYSYFLPLIIFMAALDVDFHLWFVDPGDLKISFHHHATYLAFPSSLHCSLLRPLLFFVTGLCAISLPKQMVMQNTIQHIQEIIENRITLSKTEKILTNVNWALVEVKMRIGHIIPSDTVWFSHVSQNEMEESPTDEVLMEEARLKVAIIQMSNFERQCNDGIVEAEAAQILIGATKNFCPIQGKFMSIYDVSNYVKARSWPLKFKKILTFLEHHKEDKPLLLPGSNKFLIYVHHIVSSEEFEYAEHVITLMYPVIIHLCPMARESNVSTLTLINYYYIFLCVIKSALRIIILKRKCFKQPWNTLEFLILVLAVLEIICIYSLKLRPDNLALIQVTVILGYLRLGRFLSLFKILIPRLTKIVDVRIRNGLGLMYSITKGYVKSQEDAKLLVKHISGRESIYQ